MKKHLFIIAGVLIVSVSLSWVIILNVPYGSDSREKVLIIIQKGDGLSKITRKLKNEQLVYSAFLFKWSSFILGKSKNFKRGEYHLKGRSSILELIKTLDKGSNVRVRVTIPEGLQMKEVFSVLRKSELKNKGEYESYCFNRKFIDEFEYSKNAKTLEGFLFPETYLFATDTSERTILKTMVKTFNTNIPKNYEQKARKNGLTFYQAIILASIIEKETSVSSERKIIASVFHNRLKKNMKLQTDPTVIYGIKNFDGNLTRKQLRTKTTYNTYINHGLPPTPIANPGLESLIAAVQPADTEFIFFVAKGDGTHKFTKNYREHKKAVNEFQKRRKNKYKSY